MRHYEIPGIPDDVVVVCKEHGLNYEDWCPGCNTAFDITWARHIERNRHAS